MYETLGVVQYEHAHERRRTVTDPQPFKRRSLAKRLIIRELILSHEAATSVYASAVADSLGLSRGGVTDVLKRLLAAGWIEQTDPEYARDTNVGNPKRYRLTPDGAAHARAWLRS
jgi:DNA-binding MarR family transcriptional regulator